MKMRNLALVLSSLILIGLFFLHPSFAESEESEFESCVVGKYQDAFGVGSWEVSIKKIESGQCFMEIIHEIEGGWSKIFCVIPLDEIKRSDWEEDMFPLENSDQYCELISSGNIFTKMTQVHLSPLQQTRIGIDPVDLVCSEGLVKIKKRSSDFVACVKLDTFEKLEKRGWVSLNLELADAN